MIKFCVIGSDCEYGQVLIDFVLAESKEKAESWFIAAREYCTQCVPFTADELRGLAKELDDISVADLIAEMSEYEPAEGGAA